MRKSFVITIVKGLWPSEELQEDRRKRLLHQERSCSLL